MQKQIDDIQDDVRQIKDALLGNEFGNKGIVKRLECTEKKSNDNKKKITNIKSKSVVLGTASGGVFVGIIEAIKAYFTHG